MNTEIIQKLNVCILFIEENLKKIEELDYYSMWEFIKSWILDVLRLEKLEKSDIKLIIRYINDYIDFKNENHIYIYECISNLL